MRSSDDPRVSRSRSWGRTWRSTSCSGGWDVDLDRPAPRAADALAAQHVTRRAAWWPTARARAAGRRRSRPSPVVRWTRRPAPCGARPSISDVGLLLGVAEQLLEHVGHVRHQVDRVVPHDDHPRAVGHDVDIARGLVELDRGGGRRGHRVHCRPRRRGRGCPASRSPARSTVGRVSPAAVRSGRYGRRQPPLVPSRLAPGGLLPGHGSLRTPARAASAASSRSTKPRIIELLLITTLPTMVLAQDGVPPLRLMVTTLVGGALAAGGANAMNMVIDRDIDRLMPRTQGRPLVTGLVTPREAADLRAWCWRSRRSSVLAPGRSTCSSAVLALAATALLRLRLHALAEADLDPEHRHRRRRRRGARSWSGWAAVTGSLAWPPVVLFVVIFLWTPPHFWALAIRYADDYRAADVPMLPAVASPRSSSAARCSATRSRCGRARSCSSPWPTWAGSTR